MDLVSFIHHLMSGFVVTVPLLLWVRASFFFKAAVFTYAACAAWELLQWAYNFGAPDWFDFIYGCFGCSLALLIGARQSQEPK